MDPDQILTILRGATEDDVDLVLPRLLEDGANVAATAVDLLEFFNRMIDELTGERASAEEWDDIHVVELAARLRHR